MANFNTIWQPTFTWDEATNLMVAEENAEGAIPVRSLCLHPRFHGCFVSVRYANVDNNGRVHTRDPVVGAHAQLDQIPNMIWSKVLYFSHDDMIVLESQGPESGSTVIADIEIVGAAPIDRMRGRYTQGA